MLDKWRDFQKQKHEPQFENWDIAILSGSQDGFYKILEMIIDEGDPLMVQTPTYAGTLAAVNIKLTYFSLKKNKHFQNISRN